MNDTISVTAYALNVDPDVRRSNSRRDRRVGAWRRHITIAASGLAILASAAGAGGDAAAAPDILVSAPAYVGYVKKAELGKMAGEVAVGTAPVRR